MIRICDCLDGLYSLKSNSIELCFTDPPFNIKIGVKNKKTISSKSKLYDDERDDYKDWCEKWFDETLRICRGVIIYCGGINLPMWLEIKEPKQIIYRIALNSMSPGRLTNFMKVFPMLMYGTFKNKLKKDIFNVMSINGFLRKYDFKHPCPLPEDLVRLLFKELKPTSVLDPFLGSGTTAQVCKENNIKFVGFEINKEYVSDINFRLSFNPLWCFM